MATVTKLHPDPKLVDLSGDNRMPELLEQHVELTTQLKEIAAELKEITSEIKGKIGDADKILLGEGWSIRILSYPRKEYIVKATTIRRMTISRSSKRRSNKHQLRGVKNEPR
jgi:hypothetical protein